MSGFEDPAFFGDRWAAVYDERTEIDPAAAVEFLVWQTGSGHGRALELAIGTGRVALPLTARGIEVEGVEASQAMVDRLREKPGGNSIPVAIGDMADVPVTGPYGLVYLIYNTLFNLTSQERQVDCFRNVARVLDPGGFFVIECFMPDHLPFDRGQLVHTRAVSEHLVDVSFARHDSSRQRVTYQHVRLSAEGMQLHPVTLRYCWPSELDLMARLAGLRLRARYSDWDRRPFDSSSGSHVSVYERA
ncbi:class I SAM-dependent methyltransferase [Plantactinospora sp. S1510]|uniref:Class I SAM-dependent methyltransferase n=1 Tax=Plantactinospora alkalitolerans TaxID=2789879 RepID=A0ABS0H8J1_9ACTN|nr:class I SAM-dependent methyltransferase [Plantactinospora alkalitolerans]MBF9134412.1 class I SAM-dependent methyltransferase [Plantactinospora alkalitolerans]